jgi:hypothetical protein
MLLEVNLPKNEWLDLRAVLLNDQAVRLHNGLTERYASQPRAGPGRSGDPDATSHVLREGRASRSAAAAVSSLRPFMIGELRGEQHARFAPARRP